MCSGRPYALSREDTCLRDRERGAVAGARQELGVRTPEQGFRAGNTGRRAGSPASMGGGQGAFPAESSAAAPGSGQMATRCAVTKRD